MHASGVMATSLACPLPPSFCSTASGIPGCVFVHASGVMATSLACPLPPSFCSAACGIPRGVFVHASGFIGGNDTLEGAVAMAAKALDME